MILGIPKIMSSHGPIVKRLQQARVRRCQTCGVDDLRAAFGREVPVEDTTWRCRDCGNTKWVPAVLDLPPEPSHGDACPHAGNAEP